eukprot:SAG22_NODE_112_length_19423_cov_11.462223_2_plen_99_part_00
MADVVDLTGEPEVIDLTDEPEAKRQDLSKAPLGDDLLDLVYKQLPLREKMREEMSWAREGRPYPIREVIKEIRRQERVGGGGSSLREETREAINYGGI